MLHLDDPEPVVQALQDMLLSGGRAHDAASEDGGATGTMRNLLFGLNTTIESLVALIEDELEL